MFKAVNNIRDRKGFTLIELLIVIAIIGILAAIAIPAFLGQREKAKQRSLEASARGAQSEIQGALDDYVSKTAMVFLSDASLTETCFQWVNAIDKKTCAVLYKDLASSGDVATYVHWGDIIIALQTHHNVAKEEVSPYDGTPLYVINSTTTEPTWATNVFMGHVVIWNANDKSAKLVAVNVDGTIIYNSPVSAR